MLIGQISENNYSRLSITGVFHQLQHRSYIVEVEASLGEDQCTVDANLMAEAEFQSASSGTAEVIYQKNLSWRWALLETVESHGLQYHSTFRGQYSMYLVVK